jgi:hypothetical protein
MGFFDVSSKGGGAGFQMAQMPDFSGLFGGAEKSAQYSPLESSAMAKSPVSSVAEGVSPFAGGGFGGAALGGFFSDARLKRKISRITGALDRLRLL